MLRLKEAHQLPLFRFLWYIAAKREVKLDLAFPTFVEAAFLKLEVCYLATHNPKAAVVLDKCVSSVRYAGLLLPLMIVPGSYGPLSTMRQA